MGGDPNNLLQNQLFLQYLSSLGSAISADQPVGPALDKVTQQSIASQNFMKMMSRMLAGDIPEGGKITVDGKGTSMVIPSNLLGTKLAGEAGIKGTTPAQPTQTPTMSDYLNPSNSQSGFSASDLAGLTPKDISTVMGLKLTQEDIGRKRISEVADMIYKAAKLEEGTTKQRDYEYARSQGYQGTFEEWVTDLAKASAIKIGDITAREKAKAGLKGQLYFKDPDWTGDLGKYLDSEDVQNRIFQSDNPDQVRATESVKFIENKITGGGGEIVGSKWADESKTTIEWTVKWSTGDTTTVKYKVR